MYQINLVGVNLSQADSSESMVLDLHARYFMTLGGHDLYVYGSAPDVDTDNLSLGLGKMFTFHKNVYVDPKVVYHVNIRTLSAVTKFFRICLYLFLLSYMCKYTKKKARILMDTRISLTFIF